MTYDVLRGALLWRPLYWIGEIRGSDGLDYPGGSAFKNIAARFCTSSGSPLEWINGVFLGSFKGRHSTLRHHATDTLLEGRFWRCGDCLESGAAAPGVEGYRTSCRKDLGLKLIKRSCSR
jgi:hypothetical protein